MENKTYKYIRLKTI